MSKYLVTSDWHLRNDRPVARIDEDWIDAQRKMIKFIVDTANDENASIVIGGDLFNTAIVPVRISNLFLSEIRRSTKIVYVMGGNHSLVYHQENLLDDSSVGLLQYIGGNVRYLPSEENREDGRFEHSAILDDRCIIIHTLCFEDEDQIPYGSNATHAKKLLDKYKDYSYLFLGDNHTSFVCTCKGGTVINPGTPIVQNASLIDYAPCVYIVDTVNDALKKIYVPSDATSITSDHLAKKQERDERINAFIETVKKGEKITLSFEDNLRMALQNVEEPVQDIVQEIFKEANNG